MVALRPPLSVFLLCVSPRISERSVELVSDVFESSSVARTSDTSDTITAPIDGRQKDAAGKAKAAMSTKGGKKGDTADSLPPPPVTGTSRFTFANGTTYDGQWTLHHTPADITSPRTTPATTATAAATATANTASGTDSTQSSGRKVREGKGRWTCDGDVYDGDWLNDAMDGDGTMHYVSGAHYTGQWKSGQYEGRGEYVWVDGSRYVGEWKSGRMEGEGVLEVHGTSGGGDVQRWQGTFVNDKYFDSATGYWSALPTPMHLL